MAQPGDGPGSEDRAEAPSFHHLTEAKEAMVVAFRRHALLLLDDGLYALQLSIPHLTK